MATDFAAVLVPVSAVNSEAIVELRGLFARLPAGKTSGPSGASREQYLHLPGHLLLRLRPLVNRVLAGTAPAETRRSLLTPLMKDARRFRPVTLLEVLYKACMARASDRLLDVIEKHELLHKCQYTFLRNGCIATPIEIMTAAISDSRARGKSCHLAFLDATSAYDVVPDYALELGLARIGAPRSFITWVKRAMNGHRRKGE